MSSQNERAGDEEYGTEPTTQFDAFRARRADDRAQQENQPEYVFPEEYAAAGPDSGFQPPQQPPLPPYGGYGPDAAGPGAGPGGPTTRRWRSVAVLGGAVLVAAALGIGAWAAFDSGGTSPSSGGAAAGTTVTGTATSGSTGAAGKHAKSVLTFRVTIGAIGADSFTGTVLANDENVTVELTSGTRFGTKAHPFFRADLSSGETVIVRGRRTGTDTVVATAVTANTAPASGAAGDPATGAAV